MRRLFVIFGLGAILLGMLALTPTLGGAAPVVDNTQSAAVAAEPGRGCPPTIAIGAKGQLVRDLQGALNSLPREISGPDIAVDGDFGPKTRAAVIKTQDWFGLEKDGIVGPKTWNAFGFCG